MPKTTKKSKGHRFDKVLYHIPFYTTHFFDPDGDLEDGELKTSDNMVKIPMKIDANGDDSRGNVTTWKMKGISHFDNNVEEVLETLLQLQERIIQPRAIEELSDEMKTTLQLMQLICNAGPATQTLQEACRTARQTVYDTYIESKEEENDEVQEDVLTSEETAFFEYLDGSHEDFDEEEYEDEDAYRNHLYGEFKRAFWNYLHSIIFGADAYRAFKQQKDYLLNKLIKPYGVTVEAAFRRIEVITKLMSIFPPPSSRGSAATEEQWTTFEEDLKKIPSSLKREMKYNLLPETYHDRFDTLEVDWSEMTNSKFLAEAQKCESIDARERQKMEKAKESLKRKRQADHESTASLDRSQKSKNAVAKKGKAPGKATNAGVARMCELCKMSGAPEFVYLSHNTADCKKKDEYARKLSGSAGHRQKASREYKKGERDLRHELKLLSKQVKKLTASKRSKKSASSTDDVSSVSSADSGGFGF